MIKLKYNVFAQDTHLYVWVKHHQATNVAVLMPT